VTFSAVKVVIDYLYLALLKRHKRKILFYPLIEN